MDQASTSPRNVIIAFVGAAALAAGAWFAVSGPAATSSDFGAKPDKGTAAGWR